MEAAAHHHDHHHEPLPRGGRALDKIALSATLHCLTGCAIGEVLGMIIGTSLGFSEWGTVALAVALAFFFGYALTSLPLLRSGLALNAVVPIALASDTVSIAIMEVVDNAIMLAIPGAMEAGVGSLLFWGSLSVALVIAGAVAFPFNRSLIARGKGHAVVHEQGVHGGPPTRLVASVAVVAAIFGTVVLVAEAVDSEGGGMAGHEPAAAGHGSGEQADSPHGAAAAEEQTGVRGLAVTERGLGLQVERTELPAGRATQLRFQVTDAEGRAVRDFQVEHEKRMHLIVVRRDMAGFQHLHPELDADGTWSTPVTIPEAGSYRMFADFKRGDQNHTLASDLAVDGRVDWQPLPPSGATARTSEGYEVGLDAGRMSAGREVTLGFTVRRNGRPVEAEPYLGARGHLVALRAGDLAYLHVHPTEGGGAAGGGGHEETPGGGHEETPQGGHAETPAGGHPEAPAGGHDGTGAGEPGRPVAFATEFPSAGRYRLFLQFKHEGRVHTAAFTTEVGR